MFTHLFSISTPSKPADRLVDMVLEDVTELSVLSPSSFLVLSCWLMWVTCSDYTGSQVKLAKILLNGNNICMVRRSILYEESYFTDACKLIPGGEGPLGAME